MLELHGRDGFSKRDNGTELYRGGTRDYKRSTRPKKRVEENPGLSLLH